MRVDVAPVNDFLFCQPWDELKGGDGEASAEDDDRFGHLGECEITCLVLHDEDGGDGERKLCQLIRSQLELGQPRWYAGDR